ncbi:hypothetical protein [Burkholderia sp. Ac-20345]|nr:hypothetical protein [Burkholderia sp. Ac-20345]
MSNSALLTFAHGIGAYGLLAQQAGLMLACIVGIRNSFTMKE